MFVARRVTKQVKTGLHTVSGYIPVHLQPKVIRERMEQAIKYTEELYQSFKLVSLVQITMILVVFCFVFLAFDFCRFCVVTEYEHEHRI